MTNQKGTIPASGNMRKLGVIGRPGTFAGADCELHHQILCWVSMGIEIHVVPTGGGGSKELETKLQNVGVIFHSPRDYSKLKGMHVISFCNGDFLSQIETIKKYAKTTTFVNCMCWSFPKEVEAHRKGMIDLFLYQTNHQLAAIRPSLEKVNANYNPHIFVPYFNAKLFPFVVNRPEDKFRFGRISRDDPKKYAQTQFYIYDNFVSPIEKEGHILGWNDKIEKKLGKPPEFCRTYAPSGISQQNFYAMCDAVIMQTAGTENLPRVGMEAMASGTLLITENRGGWCEEIEDGVTGWLCEDEHEFIYKASRAAYEPEERKKMVRAARKVVEEKWSKEAAAKSWKGVFEKMETIEPNKVQVNVPLDTTKRKIYVHYFPMKDKAVPGIDNSIIDNNEFKSFKEGNEVSTGEDCYAVSWGYPVKNVKHGVMETGFFHNAMFIDTIGAYQNASLNCTAGMREILDFVPPESFRDLYLRSDRIKSKYPQPNSNIEWDGVVFAAQNPADRSVHTVASTRDWYKFYEDCCKYYGKALLIKMHPWTPKGDKRYRRMADIANKYDCKYGHYNHSCIDNCEHVVTFSSSFAVDCFLRGVLVKQAVPGQFWSTGAVTYCGMDPSVGCNDTIDMAYQLVEFIGWRYCFEAKKDTNWWKSIFRIFAESNKVFPLPIELSYANGLLQENKNANNNN